MAVNPDDLPVDFDIVSDMAGNILGEDDEDLANALMIVAQQDPLAVDPDTQEPLWTAGQQKLIMSAASQVKEWRDS